MLQTSQKLILCFSINVGGIIVAFMELEFTGIVKQLDKLEALDGICLYFVDIATTAGLFEFPIDFAMFEKLHVGLSASIKIKIHE